MRARSQLTAILFVGSVGAVRDLVADVFLLDASPVTVAGVALALNYMFHKKTEEK